VLLAGVTRGALYHHFKSKADLFAAVVDSVEAELIEVLKSAAGRAPTDDPVARMRAAIQAWLDACVDASFAQIVLVDAPSIMGWEAWRAVGERYGVSLAKTLLDEAAAMRPELQNAALPYVLLGALREAGLYIAHSKGADDARRNASGAIETVIAAITASPHNPA